MSKFIKVFAMLLMVAACSEKDNGDELVIADAEGNKVVYKVELAQTRDELATGLMNRTSLDKDAGMVFDLSEFTDVPTAMWMKDTKIALDMIFIDRDGMIYWVFENAAPDSVKLIVAPYPAYAVLEVNAGDIKAKGIEIGDMVTYRIFGAEEENAAAAPDAENAEDAAEAEESTEMEIEEEVTVETDTASAPVVIDGADEVIADKIEVLEAETSAPAEENAEESAPVVIDGADEVIADKIEVLEAETSAPAKENAEEAAVTVAEQAVSDAAPAEADEAADTDKEAAANEDEEENTAAVTDKNSEAVKVPAEE